MKTPQQIADEVWTEEAGGLYTTARPYSAEVRALIAKAIEADRAQRESATLAFVRQYELDLTEEELERVADAVQWSSIPDSLVEIAFSVTGTSDGEGA
jgi:hypothetical protein